MPGKKGQTKAPNAKVLRNAYHAYIKGKRNDPNKAVPESVYIGICADINDMMLRALIDGEIYEFPLNNRLGKFAVYKRKPKHILKRVNWKLTNELGHLVYHDNRHTSGYYCTFKWRKAKTTYNRDKVTFQLMRKYDNYMSKRFGNREVDYPVKWK